MTPVVGGVNDMTMAGLRNQGYSPLEAQQIMEGQTKRRILEAANERAESKADWGKAGAAINMASALGGLGMAYMNMRDAKDFQNWQKSRVEQADKRKSAFARAAGGTY